MRKQFTKIIMLVAMMLPMALLAQSYHAVPYFENFDSPSGSPALPTGWVNYQTGTSISGTFPCCYEYSSNARSGSYYFELESSSAQTEVVATPEFDNPAGLVVDFYYCINTSNAPTTFEVGVMEDSTFVPVDTVAFTTVSSWDTYTNVRVELSSYTGDGHRIAFRASKTSGSYTVFIDDMTIMNNSTCAATPNLVSISTTSSTATITWNSEVNAVEYGVYLDSVHYSSYDTSYTLTGLNANTSYQGSVYSICSNGDTSFWTNFTFRTECGELTLPFTEDFESNQNQFPLCWTRTKAYGSYTTYPYSYSYAYYAHGGTTSMAFYQGPEMATTPRIPCPINEVEVFFYAKNSSSYGANDVIVGYITNPAADSTFVPVDTISLTSTYDLYSVNFGGVSLTDTAYVAFYANNSGYYDWYLDDVTIRQASSCHTPDNFRLTSNPSTEVHLAWTDTIGYSWEIAYGPTGINPDTVVTNLISNISEDTIAITGLADSITYDFYVRGDCGGEYSYWSQVVTARPNVTVMTVNGHDTVHTCGGTLVDDGGLTGNFTATQTSYLYVYPAGESQTVSLTGRLNMGMYNYCTLTIYEGIGETGRVLGSWTASDNNVSVASTIGPLTIKMNCSTYSGYEGFGFEFLTACSDLSSCLDPYDVEVSNVAGSSAVVSWDYSTISTPDYWNIVVVDTAAGTTYTFTAPDSARSYQVTGLQQSTQYMVSVQSSCTNGDTSNAVWSSFMTTCLAGGEITVGTGTVGLTHIINTYYNYSYCQALYRASELSEVRDSIFGVKLIANSVSSGSFNIDIYIDTTSIDSLTSAIAMSPSHRRFHAGSYTLQAGENEFRFDSVFIRPDMTSNIVVTIDNNTGSYYSNSNFQGTGGLWGTTFYQANDYTNVDPASPSGVNSTDNRPNMVFITPCADISCIAPSATASTTTTTINVSWAPGNNETAWSVEHKLATDSVWTLDEASTSATTALITGLTGNTVYDIRVSSLCGDTAASTTIQARTACVAISSLPYTQDFENFVGSTSSYNGTSDFEPCWGHSTGYTSWGSDYVYPYLYSTAHSGSKSIYMYAYSYYSFRSYLVMPEMTMSIDSLILSCWNYGGSTYDTYELMVGVMTDPSDISTFVPVDTLEYSTVNQWKYNEVEFRNYTGNGHYIAFYCGANHDGGLLIDDITVDYNRTCQRVQSAVVDTVDMTSARISFVDTNNVGDYTILWGTSSDIANATDSMVVTASPATLTGLTTAENYYAWIRTNCTDGESFWYTIGQFTTTCAATVIDATNSLYEDFEGSYPITCWTYINSSNPSNAICHSNSAHIDGNNCMRFSSYYNGSPYDAYAISPELSASSAMQFSFSYQTSSSYSPETFQVGYSTTTADVTAFTWEPTITATTSWTRLELNVPDSAKFVAIHFNTPGCYYYLYVDSLVVELAPTCIKPDAVTATNVTGVSAQLNWHTLTPAPAYEVQYKAAGDATWATLTAYADSVVINGLSNLTNYNARVRCLCGVGDTSLWSDVISFQTEMCDNPIVAINYTDSSVATTTSYIPGYSFYNYSYSEVLVDAEYLTGMTDISAFAFETASATAGNRYTNCDIYFGHTTDSVLNDWHYDSTYVHVYHGDLNYSDAGWQIISLDTTFTYDGTSNLVVVVNRLDGSYADGSSFVAHEANGNHSMYYYDDYDACDMTNQGSLDSYSVYYTNVVPSYKFINCAAGCAAPVIISETHDYENVTLTWTGSSSNYEVNVKEAAAANWPATDIAVTGNTYTFTGLNPATYYIFRVRQDCSADSLGLSSWVETTILTDSLPCMTPSALAASDMTNAEVTFNWTANGTETAWDIHVWYASYDSIYRVNAHPVTVGGLTAGVTYNAAVRALCGSALLEGDWSDAITFTTATCPDVTGLATSNVSYSSLDLSWNADPMAQSWVIEYGNHGFNQGAGTTVTVNTNSYHVTGLSDETNYDFYVRAVCGTDWNSEGWASISASTLTAPEDSFTLTVNANDPSMGTVAGGGIYLYGETATITATANEGYVFTAWNDGVTDNPRSVVIVSDTTFTAMFQSEQQQGIDGINGISCTIYPNPATSSTTISVEGANGMVRIAVVDINGRTVASETIECSTDCAKTIDIDALAQGAYFVRITGENVNMVKKLIVR